MQSAKYDTDVHLSNENMSQTLLAQFIGRGRRVLDVGCATGYTAKVLRSLGCEVSGVEYDEQMAAQARPHLDRLEVGDVEQMDLEALFGAGSFDAVVFGDVLEHLRDPVATLRRCLPLLAPGGAVVASIPNVAHGSVRLALLHGRFDYTETGLLDRTHLRLFTRDAVLATFADAGYVPVALRRTRLGVFETEVDVREGDYDPDVVDAVRSDPEATTYQFVVQAVPADQAPAGAAAQLQRTELAEREARRSAEPDRTPSAAAALVSLPTVPTARLGVWGAWDIDDLQLGVLARVVPAELATRLPGVLVRLFSPTGDRAGSRVGLDEPVEPLGRLGGVRADLLAEGLDGVLVVGPVVTTPEAAAAWYGDAPRRDHPALVLAAGLAGHDEVPVLWGPVRPDGSAAATVCLQPGSTPGQGWEQALELPDPALLAPRVFERGALALRLPYLRAMGWYPMSGPVLAVQGSASAVPRAQEVADELLRLLEQRPDLSVVLLELQTSAGDAAFAHAVAQALGRPVHVCPVDAGVEALVAGLVNAVAIMATDPTARAVATAFAVPFLPLDGVTPGGLGDALDGLLAGKQQAGEQAPADVGAQVAELDRWFDQVAERLRPAELPVGAARLLDLSERYAALERAHAVMRARTSAEVRRVVEAAPAPASEPPPDLGPQVARLQAELASLHATRTMRVLRPARDLYSRVLARVR